MEESIFFNFRKFYGQTQLQNFEQQYRRKLGQMKHPSVHVKTFFLKRIKTVGHHTKTLEIPLQIEMITFDESFIFNIYFEQQFSIVH